MNRRFFLFAAPAIVAAPSLMKVSTIMDALTPVSLYPGGLSFSELVTTTLRERSEEVWRLSLQNNALLKMLEEQSGIPAELRGIDPTPSNIWRNSRLTS